MRQASGIDAIVNSSEELFDFLIALRGLRNSIGTAPPSPICFSRAISGRFSVGENLGGVLQ